MTLLDPTSIPLTGTHLIEAGAGTGKTHTIVTLYLRLLLERGLSVREILVVTYTVAATGELRDRIRRRLVSLAKALGRGTAEEGSPDADLVRERVEAGLAAADRERVVAAVRGFDQAAIFTIHGFCQRVLSEHAFESGSSFDSELIHDQGALVEEVVRDFWAREVYAASPTLVSALAQQRVTPTSLVDLAKRVASRPDLLVLPEQRDAAQVAAELAAAEASFAKALEPVRAMWAERGDEVIELLATAPGLKKGSYKP